MRSEVQAVETKQGVLGKGGPEVQTSGYKINKYWE